MKVCCCFLALSLASHSLDADTIYLSLPFSSQSSASCCVHLFICIFFDNYIDFSLFLPLCFLNAQFNLKHDSGFVSLNLHFVLSQILVQHSAHIEHMMYSTLRPHDAVRIAKTYHYLLMTKTSMSQWCVIIAALVSLLFGSIEDSSEIS